MQNQTYANHTRLVAAFHFVLLPLTFLTFIGSLVNLYESWGDHQRLYSAALLVAVSLALMMISLLARIFALKAQDRAIRAEENLRHFVLAGKLLPAALSIRQIIALRFAPDAEFVPLVQRAAAENMAPDAIKRAVKQWKPDTYRV
jgi:hypothetical protein